RVRSSGGKLEIVTSTLSITEVAFGAEEVIGQPLDETLEDQIDAFWDDPSTIKLREFDRIIAREARTLIRAARSTGWSLKPADAIHLASAKMVVASEIHTYDASLFKYAELIGISVREPYTDQLQLL